MENRRIIQKILIILFYLILLLGYILVLTSERNVSEGIKFDPNFKSEEGLPFDYNQEVNTGIKFKPVKHKEI